MARSSTVDPVEKFRFIVTVLEDFSGIGDITSYLSFNTETDGSNRTGFSEVSHPKASITEIKYRENIHGNNSIKVPGLVNYDTIALRRGSTTDRNLYKWYKLVNDDSTTLNRYSEALAGLREIPFNNPSYRKEILISSMDRSGKFIKHWFLSNAWPSGYKGGNDFDSASDTILVEELTISYETFLEVNGDTIADAVRNVQKESALSTQKQAIAALIPNI
jgi:phage tail-like protein